MKIMINKKNFPIIASVLGNILEWYDFSIYNYLVLNISSLFFPLKNFSNSLLMAFSVFAIGYLARPLGGIIFGQIGDNYGRSKALRISMYGMGISTFLVGLIPTYTHIGIYAPLLLIFLRIIQGISAGGELVGSTVYNFEVSVPKKQTLTCSLVTCSCTVGVLLGSFVVSQIYHHFTITEIENGVWRLPFLAGSLLAIYGIISRTYLPEPTDFKKMSISPRENSRKPIVDALKKSRRNILRIVALNVFISISFYILFVWMPTFLHIFIHVSTNDAFFINTMTMSLLVILIPIMGFLGDYLGKNRIALISAILIALLSYPLFKIIIEGSYVGIFFVLTLFAIFFSLIEGTTAAITADAFPTEHRYSGIGISYNLSMSIFGGTAPLVCTYFILRTGFLEAPALYLSISAIIGAISIINIISTNNIKKFSLINYIDCKK